MVISIESIGQFMWWTSCNLGTEARAAIEMDDLTLLNSALVTHLYSEIASLSQ